jgi:transposase
MNSESAEMRNELEQMEKSTLVEMVLGLKSHVQELEAIVLKQAEALQALQDQVAKNSRNSGKPPSSDGLQKPGRRNLREQTGRKAGGQPGHEGQTLQMVEEPTHREVHVLNHCPHCAYDLSEVEVVDRGRRQVFDIPAVRIEITEHQVEVKCCPGCHQEVTAAYPEGVTQRVQYGPRLNAQASYLNSYQLLPMARTCELLGDFYDHTPSTAFVGEANRAVQQGSQAPLATIHEQLQNADLVHFDESGLRIAGQLHWLHSASTETLTYYYPHAKRGQAAMEDMGILPNFSGQAVHDHWQSYQAYTACEHIYCNAHHLRELQFIDDQYQQAWANDLFKLLLDIKAEVDHAPDTADSLPQVRIDYFSQRYDAIRQAGLDANPPPPAPPPQTRGRPKQSPPKNLLDRLLDQKAGTLAFMCDFSVPFDNNLAERDIRMVKVKQKISGAFRTKMGARTFCDLRSYISTARKQGHNVIKALFDALTGDPFTPAPDTNL